MTVVVGVLVVLHLIGWAIVLGGTLTSLREPVIRPGVLHGALTALVTGLALTGIGGAQDWDLDYVKISIKLAVTIAVVALIIVGGNRPEKVTKGWLGGIAGLTALNVALAVLWP